MAGRPQAKDLSHLYSEEAKSRNPSRLKEAFKHFQDPNIISLGGGLPLPQLFPFDNVKTDTLKPPFANGNDAPITTQDSAQISVKKFYEDAEKEEEANAIPLSVSLQYGNSAGNIKLLDFIIEHTKLVHDPAYSDWDVIMSVGNTQGWDSVLRTFTNRGDTILSEEFTFSSAAECAHGLGLNIVPAKVDLNGLVPEELSKQLDNWVGPKPKLLYTIPTGQNPTGSTLSLERRKKIYELAQKHDFLIIEDEPYYFLQMDPYSSDPEERKKILETTPSHKDFLNSLVKSYLDIDTEGRVVRLDSFSKVLSPGSRLGWIVAQKNVIERMHRLHEVTIQIPSGFVQSIVYGVLNNWGQSGYIDWLIGLKKTYTRKRDIAVAALESSLPKDICEFIAPEAGMFFWIKADGRKYPKYKELNKDPLQIEMDVYERGLDKGVQLIPGHWFVINDKTDPPQKELPVSDDYANAVYFRGTFCSVPEDKLVKAIALFGEHVKACFNEN